MSRDGGDRHVRASCCAAGQVSSALGDSRLHASLRSASAATDAGSACRFYDEPGC